MVGFVILCLLVCFIAFWILLLLCLRWLFGHWFGSVLLYVCIGLVHGCFGFWAVVDSGLLIFILF